MKCKLCDREVAYVAKGLCRTCYWKDWVAKNPLRNKRNKDNYRARRKREWAGYFTSKYKEPHCQICGKGLTWEPATHKTKSDKVCFDHKNGRGKRIIRPSVFYESQKCTPENVDVWESEDFGILCNRCNQFLPTDNRLAWLKQVIKYVIGRRIDLGE